ncbi:RHS repeat-associated core domain-containing protein [Clostridium estertheticum]|uniref:RHS repeat-associated core domain-containing protein n=1 Tax=Clostridium estertheticum TaxID=238834 RepID=UPI00299D91AD|nr:RHS repeat-associated core domain-containing protein [Clostridium estertheticum]
MTYTGQQFDGITQQYYLRARFYNPVIGRFTQEDVYRGDGLNLYAYCGNNPVGYCDPSGYNKRVCSPSKTQAMNDTNGAGKADFIVDTDGTVIPMESSYNSFYAMKKELGPAGKGKAWHHIVEQNTTNKANFVSQVLQNKRNIVLIEHGKGTAHAKISGLYSSKSDLANGIDRGRFRDYVSQLDYGEQFETGMDYLKELGGVSLSPKGYWIFTPR